MARGADQRWHRAPAWLCIAASLCVALPALPALPSLSCQVTGLVTARDSADATARDGDAAYELGTKQGAESSILHYLRAAESYRRIGALPQMAEMLSNIAYVHNSLGRPDSALVYYSRLIVLLRESHQRAGLGEALSRVGEVYHGLGQMDSALFHYRNALVLAREAQDRRTEGRTLSNIGVAFQALGRPDSALGYLNRALVIRQQLGDSVGEGVTLNNLAMVLQLLGRPDSALVYLRHSLLLRRAVKDRAGEGTTLNNIGYSFEQLAQRDSALAYYREALLVLREVGRRWTVGITLANMGRVWLELGRLDSALVYLNEGLGLKREVGDKAGETWALNDLGRVYQSLGQPDTAVRLLNQALALLREVGDRAREGETLYNLAQVFHRSKRDFRAAVAYYDSASATRAQVGRFAGGDANRLSFAEQDVQLYQNWALAWLAWPNGVGGVSAEAGARASLAAAERGRAQALLDLMRGTSRETGPGRDLATEGGQLLARATHGGAAVLSYLVTQDTLLLWVGVPGGEVVVVRRALPRDTLAQLVGAFRAALGAGERAGRRRLALRGGGPVEGVAFGGLGVRQVNTSSLDSVAHTLSALLLPPGLGQRLGAAREIVVVPHGSLGLVPFAALFLDSSAAPLGNRYAVRYAPSLAALGEAEARAGLPTGSAQTTALRTALVVGNPVMPTKSSSGETFALGPLPQAEAEGRWVAQRLGTPVLVGAQASEAQVRGRLPRAAVVHLATHGYAYAAEARARQSFIALAPGAGQDGFLTVGEVLDDPAFKLRADLVVLSACQTGLGDLKQAEGTVGLQRAFLAKGARSVLVSLWSVSDEATALLMKHFYTHWLGDTDHPSKAEALRRAQEDVRARPEFHEPKYWAAFELVGAG